MAQQTSTLKDLKEKAKRKIFPDGTANIFGKIYNVKNMKVSITDRRGLSLHENTSLDVYAGAMLQYKLKTQFLLTENLEEVKNAVAENGEICTRGYASI